MFLGQEKVWAATPGAVDVGPVSGCELVRLVLVGQLGLAATCTGLGGEFSLASWYPDARRLLDLTVATLEAGGADVERVAGGIRVTGAADARGADGATVDRGSTPDDAAWIDGAGAVAPAGASDLIDRARVLVGDDDRVSRSSGRPADELRDLARSASLDVEVASMQRGSVVIGASSEVELLLALAGGDDWLAHTVPGLAGGPEALAWIEEVAGVRAQELAGRVVIEGHREDVLHAVRAMRELGLVRQARAADVALIYGSRADLADWGVELDVQVSGADYVVGLGDTAGPVSVELLADHVRRRSGIDVEERPSLALVDGRPGRVSVGRDVPVLVAASLEDGPQYEYRRTGTIVDLVTEPAPGGRVRVQLRLEVSAVDGVGQGGNPVLASRLYEADVELEPGRTAVVASLESASRGNAATRGWLARKGSGQESRGMLTVLLHIR